MDQIQENNKYLRIDDRPEIRKKFFLWLESQEFKYILFPYGKLKPWNFFTEKGLNLNNFFFDIRPLQALPE